jgi:hypothetical protein
MAAKSAPLLHLPSIRGPEIKKKEESGKSLDCGLDVGKGHDWII